MAGKAVGWAFEQSAGSLLKKAVLVKLADNADEEGYCYPSKQKIADQVEASPRAVQGALRDLEEQGLLSIEERVRGNGSQTSNRYRLNLGGEPPAPPKTRSDAPPGGDPAAPQRNPREEPPHTSKDIRDHFEKFWSAYPARNGRKVGKEPAFKQFRKLTSDERLLASTAAPIYADETDSRYVKDAHRWLRDRLFNDYLTPKSGDVRTPEEDGYARL